MFVAHKSETGISLSEDALFLDILQAKPNFKQVMLGKNKFDDSIWTERALTYNGHSNLVFMAAIDNHDVGTLHHILGGFPLSHGARKKREFFAGRQRSL